MLECVCVKEERNRKKKEKEKKRTMLRIEPRTYTCKAGTLLQSYIPGSHTSDISTIVEEDTGIEIKCNS